MIYNVYVHHHGYKWGLVWLVYFPMESVHNITQVASTIPVRFEMSRYNFMSRWCKFVCDLRQVGGFLRVHRDASSLNLASIVLLKMNSVDIDDKQVAMDKYTLKKTKGAIKNGQSRETGNIVILVTCLLA